jgi:hypothetical protein
MATSQRTKRKRRRRAVASTAEPGRPRASARAVIEEAERPLVDLAAERSRSRRAGAVALLAATMSLASVIVAANGSQVHQASGTDKQLLLQIAVSGSTQEAVAWVRLAGVLLLGPVAVFLYRAVSGRAPSHRRFIPIIGVIGLVIFAVSLPWEYVEIRDAARAFVAAGPRTLARADHLVTAQRDMGPLRMAEICRLIGAIMFGIWVAWTSWDAQKVGLLTRFLAYLGIAAGILSAIGISVGQDLFIAWLASVGLLAVGYWPGGRPPAWDAGRAMPWDEVDAAAGPVRSARADGRR